MNKAINVNLAGMIFFINEDAYQFLNSYLDQVKAALSGDKAERDEVMTDVENRIAELLKQRLAGGKEVADMTDVQYATEIIGSPSEFGSGKNNEEFTESGQKKSIWRKKLYRDADENVFGGVCSGLGHWLDIDAVLMRILFVVLFFVGGSAILIYIILWIIIPKAKTEQQKREMRSGTKEFVGVSAKQNESGSKTGDFFRFLGEFLSNGLKAVAKIILVTLGIILAIVGILIILVLVLAATVGFSAPFAFNNMSVFFNEFSMGSIITAKFFFLLLVVIPAALLIYAGVLLLIRKKFDRRVGITALLLWFVSLVVIISLVISNIKGNVNRITRESVAMSQAMTSKTLYLSADENVDKHVSGHFRWFSSKQQDEYFSNGDNVYGSISLVIEKSKDENVQIVYKKTAAGRNDDDAERSTRAIDYQYNVQDSSIVFDKYFSIKEGLPFHMQDLEVVIYIPEGKTVVIDSNMDKLLEDADINGSYYIHEIAGNTWVMGKNGLEKKE